jgi:ATP-binding cassette, subfamily B, bacterial MsbA
MSARVSWRRLGATMGGLRELSGDRVRLLPLMVGMSVLAFLFEGLAIYLIFPLIETLGGSGLGADRTDPIGWISRAFASVPEDRRVAAVVAAIVVCVLLKSVISYAATAIFANATQRIGDDIRRRSFEQVLAASPLFHGSRPAGAMVNTLASQTWAVSQGLEKVAHLLMQTAAVLVFLTLLLLMSGTALLAILAGVVVAGLTTRAINRAVARLGRQAVHANEALTVRMMEGLSGHTTLRLFNGEAAARQTFGAASDRTRRTLYHLSLVSSLPQLTIEVIFASVIGVVLVLLETGSVGEVLVLVALLLRMQPHAMALVHARAVLAGLGGAIENLEALRDAAARTREPSGLPPAPAIREAIGLSHVSFSYPQAEEEGAAPSALEDVSFDIPAGRVTALVGHSGAGKSTVAMLLCRLAAPDAGAVRIDDADLAGFDGASWRERCAFVPQNVFLFNDTVRNNIALGRPGAGDADILDAARRANAHDFILELPQGYDTRVGDRGDSLSGGQRQRIALARALLREPELLILDEATNALDPRSERLVSDALHAEGTSRTTVVIAHRLSTVMRADRVVVLDRGRVVETGTPAALARRAGAFANLFAHELERA